MIDDESFRNGTVAEIRAGVMYFAVTDFHFNNNNFQPSGPSSPHSQDILKKSENLLHCCYLPSFDYYSDRGMFCISDIENSSRPRGFMYTM